MKSLDDWLKEYGESHQNRTNRYIHKLCVPLIFISIYFILFSCPFPLTKSMYLHWGNIVYLFALIFYFRLSIKVGIAFLTIGFLLAFFSMIIWLMWFYSSYTAMLRYSTLIFIIAWIGQFIGHKIEGKKPSFFKDLQFLLIGPLWVILPRNKKAS